MARKRKLKSPLNKCSELVHLPGRGKFRHQRVIVAFHQANQAKARATTPAERALAEAEMTKLGGMAAYQGASVRGAKRLTGASWIAKALHGLVGKDARKKGMWLVDVGALSPQYDQWPWITAVSLDLRRNHPAILQLDFLLAKRASLWAAAKTLVGSGDDSESIDFDWSVDVNTQPDESIVPKEFLGFDCVALSLVLNFEPIPAKRGAMLRKARSLLRPGGWIGIVLPLACIDNSRYCNEAVLDEILERLECARVATHRTPRLHFAMYQLRSDCTPIDALSYPPYVAKRIRRESSCNNFTLEILE